MNKHGITYILDGIAIALTFVQENQVLQIISLVFAVIASACSIILSLIKFFHWLKEALKDGKITKEELEEGEKIVDNIKKDCKNNPKK